MKKIGIKSAVGLGIALFPFLALAQTATNAGDAVTTIIDFINNQLVPLVFALAFIVFIWGVFRYFIFSQGDEEAKERGRALMVYGLIGFFVMASVWGIINVLVNTFDLDVDSSINLPEAPRSN